MSSIKVSIIIPIYNVAKYVEKCIQSVFNQTYSNIEIIIVDDCGTDNSMEIIYNIISNYDRNKYLIKHHHKNLGISAARNTGINTATGDYIYFLDSDDYIYPYCIESFVSILQDFPNVDMIIGSSNFHPLRNNLSTFYHNHCVIKGLLLKDELLPVSAWNKFINKTFIINHKLFFYENIVYEDVLYNWDIAKHINSIAFNKTETYYYRSDNPNSIMHHYGNKEMDSEVIIIKQMVRSISLKKLSSQLIKILHFSHTAYVRRYGNHEIIIIRYINVLFFLFMTIVLAPNRLRNCKKN